MKPLPLINGAFFVSSSFLDTLVCPRKSEYYKLDARISTSEGGGLMFGRHLHSALALHNRLQEYNLGKDTVSSRVSQLLEQEFAASPIETDDFRTLNWASTIYEQYAKKFASEDWNFVAYKEPQACKNCGGSGLGGTVPEAIKFNIPCLWCNGTGKTSLMVEVTFVVKLFDYVASSQDFFPELEAEYCTIPIYYHGIIDLPIIRNGLNFVLDFKSTSKLGPSYWDDKRMIAQPKGYCWAMENLLGVRMHGYYIRALRTIEPPKWVVDNKPSRTGEVKKIEEWWSESLGEERFDLGEGELDEWRDNAIEQVEQFFWHYSRGKFPQNKTECAGKYGRCQYFDVCSTFPATQRDFILSSGLYKNKEQNKQLTNLTP